MLEVGFAEYVEDVAPEIAESDEHVDDVPLYNSFHSIMVRRNT